MYLGICFCSVLNQQTRKPRSAHNENRLCVMCRWKLRHIKSQGACNLVGKRASYVTKVCAWGEEMIHFITGVRGGDTGLQWLLPPGQSLDGAILMCYSWQGQKVTQPRKSHPLWGCFIKHALRLFKRLAHVDTVEGTFSSSLKCVNVFLQFPSFIFFVFYNHMTIYVVCFINKFFKDVTFLWQTFMLILFIMVFLVLIRSPGIWI